MGLSPRSRRRDDGIIAKLYDIDWLLPMLLFIAGLVGVAMIYAARDGVWEAGAQQHLIRLSLGFTAMIVIALVPIRFWFSMAYPAYIGSLLLLIAVEFFGVTVNGSQRWLDLGVTRVQPSELMKIAIVMALARFYHDLPDWRVSKPMGVFGAILIIIMPVALVLNQPDLGTAILILLTGLVLVFMSGISWRIIAAGIAAAAVMVPLFYRFGLKDYQRERIWTFLDPSRDPTGASYQVIQSQIALGSGGVGGKGFMNGTQTKHKYVPENTTDFIFTGIGEQFGFQGSLATIALYMLIIGLCIYFANQVKQVFSKHLIIGIAATFSFYTFINLAMIMGLAPVVGVPLPLISYGGTVILAVLAGFGLILSAMVHKDTELPRGTGLLL